MRKSFAVALAGMVMAMSAAVSAQEDVVEKRQEEMKGLGDNSKALKAIIIDQQGELQSALPEAQSISETATQIPEWFPEGSGPGEVSADTDALPVIWEQPDEYEASAQELHELAGELMSAIESGDRQAAARAFAAMGKNGCGGCHQDFRKKDS